MPPGEEHAAFTVLRGAPVNVVQPLQRSMIDAKFTRALDVRLRRLKDKEVRLQPDPSARPALDDEKSPGGGGGRRSRRAAPDADKPRFVTTVKTGQFLLPPPEVASLLGLETLYPAAPRDRLVYSYASKPQAVAARGKRPLPAAEPPGKPGCKRQAPAPPCAAGRAFAGVRALVAGVAGMTPLVDKPDGSMATTQYSNVMHDKRVVRGSTFGTHPQAAGDGLESAASRAARTRRRALARRAAAARLRPGTPPPAPGRRHHPIQTEYYLEELFDKGVELEVGVQTDLFVDRPATPIYVPAKTGADASTQIYPGDLFDFDLEVQPILEVLVGKTTEQALAEVAQEEELAALREQQRRYGEAREAERAERARLAAQDARLQAERGRRVAQARAQAAAARGARDRAAAAALAHGYLAELLPAVLAGLRDQGYLVERVRRGLDEEFLPWLEEQVAREMEAIVTSRDVIAEIVRDVVEARAELYRAAGERRAADAGHTPPDSVTPPSELEGEGEDERPEQP